MGLRFPDQVKGRCFFVTTTFRNHQRFGDVPGVYIYLADSINFCLRKYSAHLIVYAFMPSHLHLILVIDGKMLSGFMRDFKKYISQKAALDLSLPTNGLWQLRYDRLELDTKEIFLVKANYIHFNPVKNRLVEKPEDWIWSSAGDYILARKGVIPISKDL